MQDKKLFGQSMIYVAELMGAFAIYTVVLFATIPLRDAAEPGLMKTLWALAPAPALILAFWAIIRHYNRLDEMMQRAQSEAFALGAIIFGLIMMVWGFGENGGFPVLPTIWVTPLLILSWGLSMPIVLRRYR